MLTPVSMWKNQDGLFGKFDDSQTEVKSLVGMVQRWASRDVDVLLTQVPDYPVRQGIFLQQSAFSADSLTVFVEPPWYALTYILKSPRH